MKAHVWFPISRGLNFMFCGRCGLINLKNPSTERCIRRPCTGREDD
jgi:hypothetical protein